jgi:TonB family protein
MLYSALVILGLGAAAPANGVPGNARAAIPPAKAPQAQDKARGPSPSNGPGQWITTWDYPAKAIREKLEGETGFRLAIDAQGRVTSCTVTVSSGSALLDETTCKLVTARARFTPAIGTDGRPSAGFYSSRMRWKIPSRQTLPLSGNLVISMMVEPDGSVSDCKVVSAEGAAAEFAKMRPPCVNSQAFEPKTNGSGRPVRRRIVNTSSVSVEEIEVVK